MKRTLHILNNAFLPAGTAALLFLASCTKFTEADPPVDQITSGAVYATAGTATAALLGVYSDMMSTSLYVTSGATTVYGGLSSDELLPTSTSATEPLEFYGNALTAGNTAVQNLWLRSYRHIYQVNHLAEGLERSTDLDPALKNGLLGEALFLRAFLYGHLVNLFGDIPLVTQTDYRQNAAMPRTATAAVYALMADDLQRASTLLSDSYPSAGRARPNRAAARALLARLYLYRENWAAAETEASAVISNPSYGLENDPNKTFLATSREALWQLAPVASGFNTTEGRAFIPTAAATTRPPYALTASLMAAFEAGDSRRSSWTKSKTVGGQTFYYPYKYKIRDLNQPVTEYYTVLRLAELYLVRAEARARQQKLPGAIQDLNVLRTRAGLAALPLTLNGDAVLAAVEKERRTELFAEWGHRWFDLKRTGRAVSVLGAVKTGFSATDQWYPIPAGELLLNPALTQNAGY
jgi:hypothetical protein